MTTRRGSGEAARRPTPRPRGRGPRPSRFVTCQSPDPKSQPRPRWGATPSRHANTPRAERPPPRSWAQATCPFRRAARPKSRRLNSQSNVLRTPNRVGPSCGSARCKAVSGAWQLELVLHHYRHRAGLSGHRAAAARGAKRGLEIPGDLPAGRPACRPVWSEPATVAVMGR